MAEEKIQLCPYCGEEMEKKLQEIAGQTNRRVGIISHREELVERIPVKIRVKKKGEGRSLVEITNE